MDLRFTYAACASLVLLGVPAAELRRLGVGPQMVLRCQNADGGFGSRPGGLGSNP